MAYTQVDAFAARKIPAAAALYIIAQDAVFNPDSTSAEADLSKVEDSAWKNINRVKTLNYKQGTADDEEESFDAPTSTWVKKANTYITDRTYEVELERTTPLFEAMYYGVADPLGEESITAMGAGQKLEIFRSNDPYIPVGVRLEIWDKAQKKYKTQYFYADLRADAEMSYDGKIIRPKVTLEVSPSVWNMQENTENLTGQVQTGN